MTFAKQNTCNCGSLDHLRTLLNSILTRQTSEKVDYKPGLDYTLECFLQSTFARIISVLSGTKTKIWVKRLQKKLKFCNHNFFVFVILFAHKDAKFLVVDDNYYINLINLPSRCRVFDFRAPVEFVNEKCFRNVFMALFAFCFSCKICSCYINN